MNQLTDYRQFPRVSAAANLRWRVVEGDEIKPQTPPDSGGLQINISGGGICFATPDPLATGAMLAIELQLPGYPSGVIALARVVWCRKAASGHEVAAEFHWVGWDSTSVQEQVLSYIREQLD